MQIGSVKQQKILQTDQVKTQKKPDLSETIDLFISTLRRDAKEDAELLNMKQLASQASMGKNIDRKNLYDIYEENLTPVHVAGGALLGAGIAHVAGVPGGEILAAAGAGAVAGYFADDPCKALFMAGGAVVATAIASFAGLPAAAVVSAAGTGTFVGWLVS